MQRPIWVSRCKNPLKMWDLKRLLLALTLIGSAFGSEPAYIRVERIPISGGAELITWFERLPQGELPLLAALNDSRLKGDGLRQVWVFTFAPPSLRQRLMGAIPFLYRRQSFGGVRPSSAPRPILDIGAPSRGTWTHIATAALEMQFVHPAGAIARLTTRSYGGNLGEYKTTHIWEALDVMSAGHEATGLTADELAILQSRLQLSGRMFGGLVSDEALPVFHEKFQTDRASVRGHNWELLRQAAEENGLRFEPLALGNMRNSFALIEVSRADLQDRENAPSHFDGQFLKIENPYDDPGLLEHATHDLIPLALYSLDYPGVPLLLVDFQRPAAPKRAEMALRFADDVAVGVLGLSGFAHWDYLAAKASWMFVHKRHGAPTNRAMRRRAFVALRHALGADASIDAKLRAQLADRIRRLDLDPLDQSWDEEVSAARAQYDALLKSAIDPAGLPRVLQADRQQEARALAHDTFTRAFLQVAAVGTLGAYRHRDEPPPALEPVAQPPQSIVAGAGE
jgi:hypothetical protein